MPTDEIIIRLFCMVDNQIADVNKHSDAKLYPSEIVTICSGQPDTAHPLPR